MVEEFDSPWGCHRKSALRGFFRFWYNTRVTAKDAYIAFNLTDRIGSVGVGDCIREHGDVVSAWENYPRKVSRLGGPVDWEGELELAEKFGVTILTPVDADYPRHLLEVPQHPLCLYVKGDVKALSRPAVAVIGTRRATAYGLDQANRFGFALAQSGWMVLSGLALGVDAESHRGALAAGGVTVGVIGSGLDRFYPEQNRELARDIVKAGGAVVSQFPFGREPDTETFPIRNQVVAALSQGVLAVECPLKSGTLITTSIAADLGRTVMALPSRVDSRAGAGCLKLIRDGAVLVRNLDDINEALSELLPNATKRGNRTFPAAGREAVGDAEVVASELPRVHKPELPEVTLEESVVLRHIDGDGVSLEKLVLKTGFDAAKLGSLCMSLRLKSRLRYLPGNRVSLSRQP